MKLSLHLVILTTLLLIITIGLISMRPSKLKPVYASNSASLNYTALGDSITAGNSTSYVPRYKNYINTDLGVPVNVTNLGVPFMFSAQLLDKVKNDQAFRDSVRTANLVTVFIGFNDFAAASALYDQGRCNDAQFNSDCLTFIANGLSDNLTNIIAQIKSINANAVILLSDLYNPWISYYASNGTTEIFIPYMTRLNNSIRSIATNNGLGVTNVYLAFNGPDGSQDPVTKGYIADGVHPSNQGYEVIATQFRNFNNVLLAKDTDGDGFTNASEKYYGTDLLASCPQNSSHSAWPPDFSNDGKVNSADISMEISYYGRTCTR